MYSNVIIKEMQKISQPNVFNICDQIILLALIRDSNVRDNEGGRGLITKNYMQSPSKLRLYFFQKFYQKFRKLYSLHLAKVNYILEISQHVK